jgi:integrase
MNIQTERSRARARPNRMVFTEKNVLTLRPKRKPFMIWDGGQGRGSGEVVRGLGVLVSPLGTKSYRSYYYFPGSPKPHTHHLGRVGVITLEEARSLCKADQRKAKDGIDPNADNPSKSDSYKSAVEQYIKQVQIGQDKRIAAKSAERVLLADCEDWWPRSVGTIRPQEVYQRLLLIRDGDEDKDLKPRPYLANLLYARLRPFFAWCAKPLIGKIKVSPMLDIEKPWTGEERRDREWFKGTAADQFIRKIWQVADQLDKTDGAYLKMLVLTGKRKNDLVNMQWQEIDRTWFWNPPPGAKNKRLHPAPLPKLAQRILHPQHERGFVFAGKNNKTITTDQRLQKKIIALGAPDDFIFHGIRHLVETKMAELKIQKHLRDLLLDHSPGQGSGKIYNHHEYLDELWEASERWAEHIERLTQPDNLPEGVTRLRG